MDPFLDLPEDKLYEICEILELPTLTKFARTSKHIQYVCGNILRQRKIEFLLPRLTGNWYKCFYIDEITNIRVRDLGDLIEIRQEVEYDSPITDKMEHVLERELFYIYNYVLTTVEKGDLENLEKIYAELTRRNYKKFDKDDIWGAKSGNDARIFYKDNSGRYYLGYLKNADINQLNYVIQRLNITITGNETIDELKNLIIEELSRRNKLLICNK